MTHDLLNGSPTKSIVRFGIPVFLGNAFQQIFNMTDAAIVGNFVGREALAGVGASGSLHFMVIGCLTGICAGFSIPVAQSFGAGDIKAIKKYFANGIILSAIFAIIMTALTLFFLDDILTMMKTPDDIYAYTKTYIGTLFAGMAGLFLYNLLASVMRALGDSRTPLILLVFSAILNLLLDFVFVLGFNWGVFGTAIATVISQTLAGLLCVFIVYKKVYILHIYKENLKPNMEAIAHLLRLGIPMGLQFSITAIGGLCVQTATNTLGSVYVAAVTSGGRIWCIPSQMFDSIGVAIATFAGQNFGAGNLDRVKKGMKGCQIISFIYALFIFGLFFFVGNVFAQIFVDASDVETIKLIHSYMTVNAFFMITLGPLLIFRSIIQGLGYSTLAMMAGFFEMVARCIVAFVFVEKFGFNAILFSNAAAWCAADIFLFPAYLYVMKKAQGVLNKNKLVSQVSQPK